jgi:two-component system cell cycle sensor histidine kinase/response regulator CckA
MATGIILIVDDDEAICELVTEALAPHRVISALCGEDALAVLRGPLPIDVLICDVVLPGRYDGFALARQAKALRPTLQVLYARGYFSALPAAGDHDAFYGKFLAKPFTPSTLRDEIDRALGSPSDDDGSGAGAYRWRRGAAA